LFMSSWFNFGASYVLRNISISSWFSSFLEYRFSKYSYDLLNFIGFCCNIPFFISDFINFGLLFSYFGLAKGLSILFIFSKTQHLVSLIHCIILLVPISLISALMCIISFYLILLGLACSFFLRVWGESSVYLRAL
jgi:hypothetical protein